MALNEKVKWFTLESAEDETSPVEVKDLYNISLNRGTWAGTASIYRSFDGTNWMKVKDVSSSDTELELVGQATHKGCLIKVVFSTRTSGSLIVGLG